MSCYACRRSPWMREKTLTFLQNFLETWREKIDDNDLFAALEISGAEKLLARRMHETLPEAEIQRLGNQRSNYGRLDLEDDDLRSSLGILWHDETSRKPLKKILPELFEHARQNPPPSLCAPEADPLPARLQEIQTLLKLSDLEMDILAVALAADAELLCSPMSRRRTSRFGTYLALIAPCLKRSEDELLKFLGNKSPLRKFGCLDNDLDPCSTICEFLDGSTSDPLASSYFAKDTGETLPWSDFGDLARTHGDFLKRILTSGDRPANILLYGAPGTGKTAFARALARELGRTCYAIAQDTSDRNGRTVSTPDFRFGALQVCDAQVPPAESLIIVDEADEMLRADSFFPFFFGPSAATVGDKGMLNTVLDELKTSTIWITNTPARALDESSRRRFDYSICFKPLNSEQRKCIWRNNLKRLKATRLVTAAQVEQFSALYPVSAGGISQTLENLVRLKPRRAEVPALVERLMKPHCELMGISLKDDKLLPSKDYTLDGLNLHGEVELPRIIEAVRAFQNRRGPADPDRPRMNLLLSGPPGTGKTEFVKYLASVLRTKVNVRMGSDLLSMWVGGTEKNIRDAFAEAEAEHAILFLDEIDGLVQSRAGARASWEVTQVNELLHQMENFDGVMIGATNFLRNLDGAIHRRFTFKLEFDYLDDAGKILFFEKMFHCLLSPEAKARLCRIPNLAPGDFRTVRQSLFYYGGEISNTQRLDALEREAAAKKTGAFAPANPIGF